MTAKDGTFEIRSHDGGRVIQLTYQRTQSQRIQGLITVVVVMVLWFFVAPWSAGAQVAVAVCVIVGAALVARFERSGVELSAEGVRVRRFLRPEQVIPWAEVADVRVRIKLGLRCLVLHRHAGWRVRLPAPLGGFNQYDSAFEAKRGTILAWWEAGRTAQSLPPGAGAQLF